MVGYYERRADNPESAFVVKAATVLGVTTDELLGLEPGRGKRVVRKGHNLSSRDESGFLGGPRGNAAAISARSRTAWRGPPRGAP